MSYLLDRKIKRRKFSTIAVIVVFLFISIYFRSALFSKLSYVAHFVFKPVVVLGNNIGDKFSSTGAYFKNKKLIVLKNEELQAQLNEMSARVSNYSIVLDENNNLKEILGRKTEKANMILSAILSKPNKSIYDTLIIDAGANQGIKIGEVVFALGNVPIGRVAEVDASSSKVVLFSNPKEKTEVVITPDCNLLKEPVVSASGEVLPPIIHTGGNIFMQIVGRGGGNFEMILPRDLILEKGTEVHLPGITPYILGVVQTIISDPRDAFQKALLTSPVNIQELKFVEVQI
ncbi:MAG: rod shape-determining protein MreC [Minisyncoccia bacterium]